MADLFYCDRFVLPLPDGHRFPMDKYRRLRERLEATGRDDVRLLSPPAATDGQLLLVHDAGYWERVKAGTLSRKEVLRSGFPWSPMLVQRSRRSTGATIAACRSALRDGFAANLAGGTHHAFADAAEGFCYTNDAAVAARVMRAEGRATRTLVLDCDVHQGNGTAAIAAGDDDLFTFSIHGARNFPARKEVSDLDVPLADGTGDDEYLEKLAAGLDEAFARFAPDLVIYTAGADPLATDRYGRMGLTKAGLLARDRLVFGRCRGLGLPVAVTMAGGYAPEIDDIVDVHFATVTAGLDTFATKPVTVASGGDE